MLNKLRHDYGHRKRSQVETAWPSGEHFKVRLDLLTKTSPCKRGRDMFWHTCKCKLSVETVDGYDYTDVYVGCNL